jgi:hypothetical protein
LDPLVKAIDLATDPRVATSALRADPFVQAIDEGEATPSAGTSAPCAEPLVNGKIYKRFSSRQYASHSYALQQNYKMDNFMIVQLQPCGCFVVWDQTQKLYECPYCGKNIGFNHCDTNGFRKLMYWRDDWLNLQRQWCQDTGLGRDMFQMCCGYVFEKDVMTQIFQK